VITTPTRRLAMLAAILALAAAAAGCDGGGEDEGSSSSTTLVTTTPAPTGEAEHVTWALYREPNSLDPIYAFDYPENTVVTTLCDSLLRQEPDGTIVAGLAELSRPDEMTLVLTLKDGVTFTDGTALTADDVVYSLERQRNPKLGGFYGAAFDRVKSIEATTPSEVTITLSQPDYWLDGELSSMPGIVISKAYAESKGASYGTPKGGVMCTGAFSLEAWKTGDRVTVTRNDAYWGDAATVVTIDFKGVPDEAALTSGLIAGDIDGTYPQAIPTLDQLQADSSITVTRGPSYQSTAMIVSTQKGPLGNVKVRQGLSLAIDRQGIVDTLYKGTAQLPRAIANPGAWGYGADVFQKAWDELPEPTQDVEQGTSLVEEAGATGETITLGTTNEIGAVLAATNAVKSAAESIGLEVVVKSVSAANYINFFIDPKAREGIDAFFTVNYPDYADPAALYATFTLANGSQNYSGYANTEVTELLGEARATADPDDRATLVTRAQAIIMDELPWIGLVVPDTVLVMRSSITGAPPTFVYMNAPWAASLGATG
jgi:peptide/nickel transport system substrate-binding protein